MARTIMVFNRLDDGEMLAQVGDVLERSRRDGHQLVAIIPALQGVMEMLEESIALASYERVQNKLVSIHSNVARRMVRNNQDRSLLIHDIEDILGSYAWLGKAVVNRGPTAAEAATLLATGERLAARLLTTYLQHQGIQATAVNTPEVIITNDDYMAAQPETELISQRCVKRLIPLLESRTVAIMGRSTGGTANGQTTRLNPDSLSSSYSILAAGTEATGLWFMRQRTGLMIADPELLPSTRSIPVLPLRLLTDLANYGLDLPPSATLRPAVKAHIPIYLRSMNNPAHPGTYIHPEPDKETPVVIVAQTNMFHLSITGSSIHYADVVATLTANRIPILSAESTFLIPLDQVNSARDRLNELLPAAQLGLSSDSGALITLIGMDLAWASAVEASLNTAQVKPFRLIVTSGYTREPHLSVLVPAEMLETALRHIHDLILRQGSDLL